MTRFGWVLNLDAELELARPGFSYVPRAKLTAQLAEYGRASRALLGPADVLIAPGEPCPAGLIGRAWCPTPRALIALAAAGIHAVGPGKIRMKGRVILVQKGGLGMHRPGFI
jgi:hypothetical protein